MRAPRTPADVRVGCWCFGYRKPCTYHEGWEDAYNEITDVEVPHGALALLVNAARVSPLLRDAVREVEDYVRAVSASS